MLNNNQQPTNEQLERMPECILSSFVDLLKVQSHSTNEKRMTIYIWEKLRNKNYDVSIDHKGNIIVIKGKAKYYPCIVSHLDTVHYIVNDFRVKLYYKNGREYACSYNGKKQTGIGGDDKNGIYACLYFLEKLQNVKVVFFTQEEIGVIGSSGINHNFFKDVGYIIQLDRWGRKDFISSYFMADTISKEFEEKADPILAKFGYEHEDGLLTDSLNLFDSNIGVSCINVSCGYYRHHSDLEFIDLNEFWHSLKFTGELISELGEKKYKKFPGKKNYNKYDYSKYYSNYDYNYDTKHWYDCNKTKKIDSKKTLLEISDIEIMNGILIDLGINSYNITELDIENIKNRFFAATGENIKEDYLNELIIDSDAYNAPDVHSNDDFYDY
jgi:tripeptide aminopeptidase